MSGRNPDESWRTAVEASSSATRSSVPPISYEFKLLRLSAGEAPHLAAGRLTAGFPTTPPDPAKEALKRRAANALRAYNPHLQIPQFPYEQIARFEQVSVDEARRKYRHLELYAPETGDGVRIILRDDDASVTVPFWHADQRASEIFQQLCRYLEIICRETGYVVYDPQVGQAFDPGAGCEKALAQYREIVRQLREPLPVAGKAESSEQLTTQATLWPHSREERSLPEIRQLASPEGGGVVLLAVRQNGGLCGYAQVSILHDHPGGKSSVAYLEGWYVEPEFRGQGIGRRLLESAEHWAAAGGLKELASQVRWDDEQSVRSLRTHFRCGFTETLRAVHFTKPITVNGATRTENTENH